MVLCWIFSNSEMQEPSSMKPLEVSIKIEAFQGKSMAKESQHGTNDAQLLHKWERSHTEYMLKQARHLSGL